ncbi:MAG: aspartate kinase, partial [Flavobacteriaceae bacterium]|nr:aspartate kinase [Flavobacteriaceae bacterium]
MIVLKFGGTSVGNAANIKKVSDIIYSYSEPKIVVLSAVAGTTNSLVTINEAIANLQPKEALKRIDALEQSYLPLINELFSKEQYLSEAATFLKDQFNHLRAISGNIVNEKEILAQGELLSTNLFQIYQQELGRDSALIPALDYMAIDEHGEPVTDAISTKLG